MSYPEHPDTIVIKNAFYTKGLKEIDVWNYYQLVKTPLLKETQGRDLMFYIFVDINKSIIRRKVESGYIRLDPRNYDQMITGRSVSIHSAMRSYEEFGIIDVDIDPSDGFRWAKKVTMDVYDFVMDKMPVIREARIRFTGKTSFHIVCDFGRKMKIDTIKFLLEKFLRESPLARVYTVGGKRRPGIPNLDMGRNALRANFITLNSLSTIGLRCMEVDYSRLLSFNIREALVR
jgi:hypothetical protein